MVTYLSVTSWADFPTYRTHLAGQFEFLLEDWRLKHFGITDDSRESIQMPVNLVFRQMSVL